MMDQQNLDPNFGLSDQEKNDLEQLINAFQNERTHRAPTDNIAQIQQQIDTINNRLAYLTNMFLTLDRRIKPLYETIRLNYQKSEILNQRINLLIKSLSAGERL